MDAKTKLQKSFEIVDEYFERLLEKGEIGSFSENINEMCGKSNNPSSKKKGKKKMNREDISRVLNNVLIEQPVKIEVEHPGVLEVPEGKGVDDLSYDHFLNLAKKKGYTKVIRALNNLHVWNRERNPKLANWADKMQNRISKAKEESEGKE